MGAIGVSVALMPDSLLPRPSFLEDTLASINVSNFFGTVYGTFRPELAQITLIVPKNWTVSD
jgi:hypothetical protein